MSKVTTRSTTSNQLFSEYDFAKVFLFDNKYKKVSITSASGTTTIAVGQAIGVVGVTYQLYKSGTSNISFVGIAAEAASIAEGATDTITICTGGKIAEGKVVLDGTDTLATIVSNRSIRDRIASESIDIELVATDELTVSDNY